MLVGVMSPLTWRLGDLFAKHAFLLKGLGWGSMPLHAKPPGPAGRWLIERLKRCSGPHAADQHVAQTHAPETSVAQPRTVGFIQFSHEYYAQLTDLSNAEGRRTLPSRRN
jgi:hypothetical protein